MYHSNSNLVDQLVILQHQVV